MTTYGAHSIPAEVWGRAKDAEIDAWLKTGPILGAQCQSTSSAASTTLSSTRTSRRSARLNYNLAPEYQWPVQINENEFVVRWLHAHAAKHGVDPARIALGGDSAGGIMTCVIALRLRDEGGPRLALQIPLYPEAEMPFASKAAITRTLKNAPK